ncbi:MAG TPA: ABC transporter ATP-binding protein [Tepidisphaeraceae bacterium]|nr:ABC transporter ATP-binding protein [Tepidisphaeraceae bacterium]
MATKSAVVSNQPFVSQASATDPSVPPDVLLYEAKKVSNWQLFSWMLRFLSPVKGLAFLCCTFVVLGNTAEVLSIGVSGSIVDRIQQLVAKPQTGQSFWAFLASDDPQIVALRSVVMLLIGLTLGLLVLRYLRITFEMKMSMTMVYYLREAVYDKVQRVGFKFHDALSSGQLINRSLTDLQNVRAFLQTALLISLDIVMMVTGNIILLLSRSPWVALLALAPLPIWTWYILRFGKKAQPAGQAVMEAEDRNVSLITENIAGVHVVKAFATQEKEIAKYGENLDSFFGRVQSRIRLFANFTPVVRGIATASNLTLFLAAGILIIKGKLNAGDFLILGASMGVILGRLQQVGAINEQYQAAIVSARRLYEILMAPPTVVEHPECCPLPPGPGHVRFENVTFGYDPAKPVLRDLDFEVPGGSVVAIVGPTGAGKTSLVNLLARFYDPQHGTIRVDGMDIKQCELSQLRSEVAFVFQETYLFSDTVEANIAYGRPHMSGGPVEAAARLAQAHEFIEQMPHGYQTVLAERGSSLSGGQRQRLAIARAILSNPRILVLDDATAAVDPETEDLIRRGMKFAMYGRTTFVIAHRLSTAKRADRVIVLESGRVTQMGTHDELMAEDGHYREIAAVQLQPDSRTDDNNPSHMRRVSDNRAVNAVTTAAREGGRGHQDM